MQRALVTGATGFIGGHLVEALTRRGVQVTALVRSPRKAGLLERLGTRLVRGDLFDEAALASAVAEQDVVYHVAGLIMARNEAEFFRGNTQGTANLLEAAERAGRARFVYVSSIAAGGPVERGGALKGHEPPQPVTPYGRSKVSAEALVRASQLPWAIVRPPVVYGPRDREVLKLFRMVRMRLVPVFGSGEQGVSTVFGPDLAEALIAAGEAAAAAGGTYYPVNTLPTTSAELVSAIAQVSGLRVKILGTPDWFARGFLKLVGGFNDLFGRATVLHGDRAPEFLAPAWVADHERLTRDTGWRPAYSLLDGLAATLAWYREARWV